MSPSYFSHFFRCESPQLSEAVKDGARVVKLGFHWGACCLFHTEPCRCLMLVSPHGKFDAYYHHSEIIIILIIVCIATISGIFVITTQCRLRFIASFHSFLCAILATFTATSKDDLCKISEDRETSQRLMVFLGKACIPMLQRE